MLIGWRSIALGLMTETDWIAVTTAIRAAGHVPKIPRRELQVLYNRLFAPCQKWKENTLRMLRAKIRTGSY
ncbi:hypothetical protein KIPB_012038 [Kipferlia bialata]|uniref:Uncharacterized protein n=1 Tax=Kipferlia bialata TaxID=797122 RepID=A0A391NR16_9EUKA|nr:hypothetical protein KIPB_012038 [Kipferlia bialata]|eukprot:g12038.t1